MNNAMSMTSGHETQAVGQGTCANNLFWVRLIFKEREREKKTTRDPAVQALQFLESLDSKDTNQKAQYFRSSHKRIKLEWIWWYHSNLGRTLIIVFENRNSLLEVFPIIPKVRIPTYHHYSARGNWRELLVVHFLDPIPPFEWAAQNRLTNQESFLTPSETVAPTHLAVSSTRAGQARGIRSKVLDGYGDEILLFFFQMMAAVLESLVFLVVESSQLEYETFIQPSIRWQI